MKRKPDCHYFTRGKGGWCIKGQHPCVYKKPGRVKYCIDYEAEKLSKRRKNKHGPYHLSREQEMAFLNQRIAEGWLGSRSAGSKGVYDDSLVNPKTGLWFIGSDHYFYASPTLGSTGNFAEYDRPPRPECFFAFVQLKSSRTLSLKAARDWASGKAQDAWRTTWLKCKGHRKLAEKVNAPWFREWKERHER